MTAYDDAVAMLKAGEKIEKSPSTRSRYVQRQHGQRYFSAATVDRARAEFPLYYDGYGGYRLAPEGFQRAHAKITNNGQVVTEELIPAGSTVIDWHGRIREIVGHSQPGLFQFFKLPEPPAHPEPQRAARAARVREAWAARIADAQIEKHADKILAGDEDWTRALLTETALRAFDEYRGATKTGDPE
jgi:hypothetical protein